MKTRPDADKAPPEVGLRGWRMAMRWTHLLFMHWPVDAAWLASTLPEPIRPYLDTFDGSAWLGVVPFVMSRMRHRGLPPVPVCGLSGFPELNLRTYLTLPDAEGRPRPGVWFYSLDAHSRIGVRVARRLFDLPYFDASMTARRDGDAFFFESLRTHREAPPATFRARYRPLGAATQTPDLDRFLTERYCLYTVRRDGQTLRRGDIGHAPWPLEAAEAEVQVLDMTSLLGPGGPRLDPAEAHLRFSRSLDVVASLPRVVEAAGSGG